MMSDNIVIKGNKEGLQVIVDMNKFRDFDDMYEELVSKLSRGRRFYEGSTLTLVTDLKFLNERELRQLKNLLFEEFLIRDCIFKDKEESNNKVFSGIYEGRTKFLKNTVRSGQIVRYQGNIVIIGDVNPGAEIYAAGNIVVLGSLKGNAHAGSNGNTKSIIAAFELQPKLLQIANVVTRAPEDDIKPPYPEVAKIKENCIIVEPYLINKFI